MTWVGKRGWHFRDGGVAKTASRGGRVVGMVHTTTERRIMRRGFQGKMKVTLTKERERNGEECGGKDIRCL